MKYKNTKTGYVFESDAEIKGGNWVKLNSQSSATKNEENTTEEDTTPKKRTTRKTTRNK